MVTPKFKPKPLNWRELPVWLQVIWGVAISNFASFWLIGAVTDGDALHGKIEGNHYFMVEHGHYTEVSAAFFEYSRIHMISVFGLLWLAMVVGGVYRARHPEL